MAEWSNAPDSKSGVLCIQYRGFESLSLRQKMKQFLRNLAVRSPNFVAACTLSFHVLAAGQSALTPPDHSSIQETVDFLLATAADEFKASSTLKPAAFRSVRVGYFFDAPPGRYVLCGVVQTAGPGSSERIAFATIKTSPYEQWLGGVADSICKSNKVEWYTGDLSEELQRRFGR